MSSKRGATSDLNHENWDQNEEPEDRGIFRTAPENELQHRVIKKARRQITSSDGAPTTTKNIFSKFSGFINQTPVVTTSTVSSAFSFLSKIPAANTGQKEVVTTVSASNSFAGPTTGAKVRKADSSQNKQAEVLTNDSSNRKSATYYAKLKGLNTDFSNWIKQHVTDTPICILTPIFEDYEKHLNDIENDEQIRKARIEVQSSVTAKKNAEPSPFTGISFGNASTNPPTTTCAYNKNTSSSTATFIIDTLTSAKTVSSSNNIETSVTTATTPKFSFGNFAATKSENEKNELNPSTDTAKFSFGTKIDSNLSSPSDAKETAKTNGFSFLGVNKSNEPTKEQPTTTGFSFSTTASNSKPAGGFSFTPGATPFTFGNIQPPATSISQEEKNEEDEPPKVEFKQVLEADAIYSIKCKMFVKKDGAFGGSVEGTLFLKPITESCKTQMLIRADTNLGNILVNLVLNSDVPVKRMGNKDIMMICIPTPEAKNPKTLLLRVKTAEEANELFATINKYK